MQSVKSQSASEINSINSQIQDLRNRLNSMSPEDRKLNRESINAQIKALRKDIQGIRDNQADSIQALREQQRGGSTAGFNQKGKEAAEYIKKQMETEREELTKKTNKELDTKMLDEVKRLKADIDAMRASGRGFSRKQLLSRITGLTKQTKREKTKMLAKHKAEYTQKYKDEIDKLRQDKSMYTYYDNRAKKMAKRAEAEERQRQREAERAARRAQRQNGSRSRSRNSSEESSDDWNSVSGLNRQMNESIKNWQNSDSPNKNAEIENTRRYYTEAKKMLRETGSWDDESVMRRLGYR